MLSGYVRVDLLCLISEQHSDNYIMYWNFTAWVIEDDEGIIAEEDSMEGLRFPYPGIREYSWAVNGSVKVGNISITCSSKIIKNLYFVIFFLMPGITNFSFSF